MVEVHDVVPAILRNEAVYVAVSVENAEFQGAALSTARHLGLNSSTMMRLAAEQYCTVTPMNNRGREFTGRSVFEATVTPPL
jgi:hypothetical protein